MAGMFDTGISTGPAQQNTVTTVTAGGIGDAVSTLAPAALRVAETGIGFYQDQKLKSEFDDVYGELGQLDRTFSTIQQGMAAGNNRRQLGMRARAALKSAVAVSPMLRDRAEAMYANYFGGGGGAATGDAGQPRSFELTPAEQEAEKLWAAISSDMMLGYSEQQAMQNQQLKRAAEVATQQAEYMTKQADVQLYQVKPVAATLTAQLTAEFDNARMQYIAQTGSSPDESWRQQTMLQFSQRANVLKNELTAMVTDSRTGKLTITPEALQKLHDEVDSTLEGIRTVSTDESYAKFLDTSGKEVDGTIKLAMYQAAPQLYALNQLNQNIAQYVVEASSAGGQAIMPWLRGSNPDLFRAVEGMSPGDRVNLYTGAMNKMFNTGSQFNAPLTRDEAAALADAAVGNIQMYDQMMREGVNVEQMVALVPEVLPMLTTNPRTKGLRQANAMTYEAALQDAQRGAIKAFQGLYMQEFGELPSGLQLITTRKPVSRDIIWGSIPNPSDFEPQIRLVSTNGRDVTSEMAKHAANLYRSIVENPNIVPKELQGKGLSPEEITTLWLNTGDFQAPATELDFHTSWDPITGQGKGSMIGGVDLASLGTSKLSEDAKKMSEESQTQQPLNPDALKTPPRVFDALKALKDQGKRMGEVVNQRTVENLLSMWGYDTAMADEITTEMALYWEHL